MQHQWAVTVVQSGRWRCVRDGLCTAASLPPVSGSHHSAGPHTGGCVVFADSAEDSGILSSQCLCIRYPTPCALKIADKIAEQFDSAVLLMLDGSKMSPDYRVPPIVMYERKDSRWLPKDKHMIMLRQWEETRAIAGQMLESGDHMQLVDFDSHLDDITKDWTNQKLNTKIAELALPANGNI
ncbi:ER membrane protein complex subunit 9 isoform X2 [Mastacembelus armatus]|uniref:ER membrane protein complex subunit 9 isoform X2 n=1 Tax=Mastacembelus armatus TaxID=205130 RepID=UPI000E45D933|nr:ER membrane protein complex subunit 9 isoform X2 [Mastacembelus armatus]